MLAQVVILAFVAPQVPQVLVLLLLAALPAPVAVEVVEAEVPRVQVDLEELEVPLAMSKQRDMPRGQKRKTDLQ